MRKIKLFGLFLVVIVINIKPTIAQVSEPEFIGEAYLIKVDSSTVSLDKEIADFTTGISWSSNSWKSHAIEISGNKALTRFSSGELLKFLVRAVDNNSDPLTIISIYKFKEKEKKKKKTRTVELGEDNSGTFMKSRTKSENLLKFKGKKFGSSSYLIELSDLMPGEYGIIVLNPNNRDEKRTIVSCFGID